MFGCGYLHPFWSTTVCSLSGDSYARVLPASKTVSLIASGTGSCPWDGSQVGPLVGHSLSLCSNFVPGLLVGRTNFGSQVLWVGPYPFTRSPAWLQKAATSGSISPNARSLS